MSDIKQRDSFVAQMEKYSQLYGQGALDQTLFSFFVADYIVSSKDVGVLDIIPEWLIVKLDELVAVYEKDGELTLSGSHGVTDKSDLARGLKELLNR